MDRACETLEEALEGTDVCFLCAPVAALPELARATLAAGGDCVVTDVGSTKRAVLESLAASGLPEDDLARFVGGHPLAGAEASGVEHARAELFEGATWYLTPTERTSGMLYERLYRAISALGARPEAIAADLHDHVMATISHVPHVLANVLANQAARSLGDDAPRLPATGPSFRDATRVAGANPCPLAGHPARQPRRGGRGARCVRGRADAGSRRPAPGRRGGAPALDRDRSRRPPPSPRSRSPRRPGDRDPGLRPEPPRDRGAAVARDRRGGRKHRRHGALSGCGHAVRRDRAVGRGGGRAQSASWS